MLRLEELEKNPDIELLLTPKKAIFNLIKTVNGSMLEFHKTVKTSKELETLASEFFKVKNEMKDIKQKSGNINLDNLRNKISVMKNIKTEDIDFV